MISCLFLCLCTNILSVYIWHHYNQHILVFLRYFKSALLRFLFDDSNKQTTHKVAPTSKRFYAVVLLTTVIVFQICLFSLFGFERPVLLRVEFPSELEDAIDDVFQIPLPPPFLPLNQSDSIFSFVHLRKAGGLSIRYSLLPYFKGKGENQTTTVFIFACEFFMRCSTYTVDQYLGRVVSSALPVRIVGHFSYSEVQKVTKLRNHTADCLTQLRHPLSRTLSCFYYRTTEQKKPKNITDFTPETFRMFMSMYTDMYGHGCNNEILRMFTPEKNETILNDSGFNLTRTRELVEVAKQNIAQCVVFLLETPEENRVISKEWMPEISEFVMETKLNVQKYKEDTHKIPQAFLDVLLDLNKADMELYEYGVRWHQRLYRTAARNKLIKAEVEKAGLSLDTMVVTTDDRSGPIKRRDPEV
eukprot:TRINITY_DN9185_c0_g1_i1.p1 TRINITY_DN9185_c0_g1~~TRINITY_DN9185_c0_g1_i1.p1  ORF type:complete len:415 (+),score=37.97 TRINITY_DN9185_c0_g1_i1:238-1482(+)